MFYKLFISALCFSKFLMDHNARVAEILMCSSCFESFFVQGGLAIPYIVAVCMSFKQLKITLVGINQELAETFYLELVDNSNVVGSSVQRGDAVDIMMENLITQREENQINRLQTRSFTFLFILLSIMSVPECFIWFKAFLKDKKDKNRV